MKQTPSEIFHTLSRELRHLAQLTTALQEQLSSRGYAELDIESFQSLDSLNQTLDCLATYVAHLGSAAPCGCAVSMGEAADRLCLSALAERLRGHDRPSAHFAATEVELF